MYCYFPVKYTYCVNIFGLKTYLLGNGIIIATIAWIKILKFSYNNSNFIFSFFIN